MMTENKLAEIENRCKNARKGPWISYIEGRDFCGGSNIIKVAEDCNNDQDIDIIGATIADQDFMAHARADIPQLIKEVRKLKAELKNLNVRMTSRR